VFLRKEKFTHGILLDVVMFNMWMRTERKKNALLTQTIVGNCFYVFQGVITTP
jgi:hypothetical protein